MWLFIQTSKCIKRHEDKDIGDIPSVVVAASSFDAIKIISWVKKASNINADLENVYFYELKRKREAGLWQFYYEY